MIGSGVLLKIETLFILNISDYVIDYLHDFLVNL